MAKAERYVAARPFELGTGKLNDDGSQEVLHFEPGEWVEGAHKLDTIQGLVDSGYLVAEGDYEEADK